MWYVDDLSSQAKDPETSYEQDTKVLLHIWNGAAEQELGIKGA
jgi:hypothetical protein